MSQRSKKQNLALATTIVVLALAVLVGTNGRRVDWLRLFVYIRAGATTFNEYTIPFFVISATVIAWRRAMVSGALLALYGLCYGTAELMVQFLQESRYVHSAPDALRALGLASNALGVLCLVLLLLHRLSGHLDLLRIGGIAAFAFHIVLHNLALFSHLTSTWGDWLEYFRAVFGVILFLAMCYLSWCIAFRHSPRALKAN